MKQNTTKSKQKQMKMTYANILLLSLFTILSFQSCKKENSNSFYFKCKVNGDEYVPNRCANCITCTILRDTIFLLGGNRDFETLGIGLNKTSGINIGSYILNEKSSAKGDYKNSTAPIDRYYTDSGRTGMLNITQIDKTNKIIKGDFYFKAYNAFRNTEINITQGSFRLEYTTY